jgi:hypothetical protein
MIVSFEECRRNIDCITKNTMHQKKFLLLWFKDVLSSWLRMIENRLLRRMSGPKRWGANRWLKKISSSGTS